MPVHFQYFGGMTVLLTREDGYKILLDPYLTENPAATISAAQLYDVDLVLVTHAAFDHLGDTVDILRHSAAHLIAGPDVCRLIHKQAPELDSRVEGTIYGDAHHKNGVVIRTVTTFHISSSEPDGCWITAPPLGFIVCPEPGVRYYHMGDTSIFSDIKLIRELYRPNVVTVGISRISAQYACSMTPREAAMAISWLGPDIVIPTHYAPDSKDYDDFIHHLSSFSPETAISGKIGCQFTYTPAQITTQNGQVCP